MLGWSIPKMTASSTTRLIETGNSTNDFVLDATPKISDWIHVSAPVSEGKTGKSLSKEAALILLAQTIKQHEGWYKGSVAFDNLNPGALRKWPTAIGYRRGFAFFATYEDGWRALLDLLLASCTKNPTLYQLMSWYAPESDGNRPNHYASILATKLGVSIQTHISEIYCP